MGHLYLGLVLVGSMLAVTGPQQGSTGESIATVAAAASPVRDACGKRPPRKPSGKSWRCTFVDNFDGPRLNRRHWKLFRDKVPAQKGSACRRPKNSKVAKGQLLLTVKRTGDTIGCQYTIGAVSTYHRFSQKYGRFQARIKARATRERGLQESFWLWPDDRIKSTVQWPAAGEIDIAETYSQHPDLAIPFLHYTRRQQRRAEAGAQHLLGLQGQARQVARLHAGLGAQPDRDQGRRQALPGQQVGQPSLQEEVHRRVHPVGRAPRQRADPRDPAACNDAGGLRPGLALGAGRRASIGGAHAMRAVTCQKGVLDVARRRRPGARARPRRARGARVRHLRVGPACPAPL